MSLIRDIKERRMVQFVVTYLAAGWVGVEVCGSLVERSILPEFVYTLALIWYLTGIPIAVLIGWYHGEKGNQTAPKWEVAAIVIVIVSLSGFSATHISGHLAEQRAVASAAEGRLDPHRVAVTYFEAEDPALRHVADALTEELIRGLATVRTLDVISRNGVLPYRETRTPPDSLALELRAGTLVAGVLHGERDGVRVDVRLIDGASGAEYRRTSVTRDGSDLQNAAPALAEEVARFLRSRLGEEIRVRASEGSTHSVDAWALLQQARRIRKDAAATLHEHDEHAPIELLAEADSLLAVATRLDREWADPVRERADLAYVRSRLTPDPEERVYWAFVSAEHATRALELKEDDPEALAIRGTARYWRWLIDEDVADRATLFNGAKADLERAVQRDPSRAEAYATLTHLYYNDPQGGASAVALAAQRAYDEDAYLEVADDVLWRLHLATLDMGDFARARTACIEGSGRFPDDARFAHCQLRLMATPAEEPDIERGWALVARADSLTPAPSQAYEALNNRLWMAGVLARAERPDSARAVLDRVHRAITDHVDPEGDLWTVEAAIRARLGQVEEAVALIERYLARHPDHPFNPSSGLAWWWQPIEDDPRFLRMVRLRGHTGP